MSGPGATKTGPKRGLVEQPKRGGRGFCHYQKEEANEEAQNSPRPAREGRRNRKTILLRPMGIVEDDRMDEDGK